MSKKTLIILVLVAALVALGGVYYTKKSGPKTAQNPAGPYVVGVMRTLSLDSSWDSFRQALAGLGYTEGKNLEYKVVESGKDLAETKTRMQEIMAAQPDLIVAIGVLPAQAARDLTSAQKPGLPVVFISSDPVGAKLVQSMRGSGNNLTGVSLANEVVSGKRLELLLEMVPEAKRVVFFWNDPNTSGLESIKKAAEEHKISLMEKQVHSATELSAMLDSFKFSRGDVLARASDNMSGISVAKIVSVTVRNKIPMAGTNTADTKQGALMSYGADLSKVGKQVAVMADKILRGGDNPSEIPVESPEAFDLSVNLETAAKIGLAVSDTFLSTANTVIRPR